MLSWIRAVRWDSHSHTRPAPSNFNLQKQTALEIPQKKLGGCAVVTWWENKPQPTLQAPPNEASTMPCCWRPTRCLLSLEGLTATAPNVSRKGKAKQTSQKCFLKILRSESLESEGRFRRKHPLDHPNAPNQCRQDRAVDFAVGTAGYPWEYASPGLGNCGSLSVTLGCSFFLHLTVVLATGLMGLALVRYDMTAGCWSVQSGRLKLCWRHHSGGAALEKACPTPMSWLADIARSSKSVSCPLLWTLVLQQCQRWDLSEANPLERIAHGVTCRANPRWGEPGSQHRLSHQWWHGQHGKDLWQQHQVAKSWCPVPPPHVTFSHKIWRLRPEIFGKF